MGCLKLFCFIVVMLSKLYMGGPRNQTTSTPSRLQIAIPVRKFNDFVTINVDPTTGEQSFSGFAIEVFKAVANTALPTSPIPFDLIPFAKPDGTMNGTIDEMLQAVFSQDYDGAVGEISILLSRTQWVDFTIPYLDTTISMLVPVKQHRNGGISLVSFTMYSTLVSSLIVALLYWVLVYKNEKHESRQLSAAQNAQSTRHDHADWWREMMAWIINTGLVMLLYFMVALILIACYTASQNSSLAAQQQSGGFNSLDQLIRKKANVGYRKGSYIYKLLLEKNFAESQLIGLNSEEEMYDLLAKGTAQGGVDAVVADTTNLRLFLDKHCGAFTIVSSVNLPAARFGFAFRKGTDLAYEFSNGLMKIIDNGMLGEIQNRTIGGLESCEDDQNAAGSHILDRGSLWILVVGGSGVFILQIVIYFIRCNYRKNKVVAYILCQEFSTTNNISVFSSPTSLPGLKVD